MKRKREDDPLEALAPIEQKKSWGTRDITELSRIAKDKDACDVVLDCLSKNMYYRIDGNDDVAVRELYEFFLDGLSGEFGSTKLESFMELFIEDQESERRLLVEYVPKFVPLLIPHLHSSDEEVRALIHGQYVSWDMKTGHKESASSCLEVIKFRHINELIQTFSDYVRNVTSHNWRTQESILAALYCIYIDYEEDPHIGIFPDWAVAIVIQGLQSKHYTVHREALRIMSYAFRYKSLLECLPVAMPYLVLSLRHSVRTICNKAARAVSCAIHNHECSAHYLPRIANIILKESHLFRPPRNREKEFVLLKLCKETVAFTRSVHMQKRITNQVLPIIFQHLVEPKSPKKRKQIEESSVNMPALETFVTMLPYVDTKIYNGLSRVCASLAGKCDYFHDGHLLPFLHGWSLITDPAGANSIQVLIDLIQYHSSYECAGFHALAWLARTNSTKDLILTKLDTIVDVAANNTNHYGEEYSYNLIIELVRSFSSEMHKYVNSTLIDSLRPQNSDKSLMFFTMLVILHNYYPSIMQSYDIVTNNVTHQFILQLGAHVSLGYLSKIQVVDALCIVAERKPLSINGSENILSNYIVERFNVNDVSLEERERWAIALHKLLPKGYTNKNVQSIMSPLYMKSNLVTNYDFSDIIILQLH